MNQRGVEVLVTAALAGRRQVRHHLFNPDGGRCAMGFLCEAENVCSTGIFGRPHLVKVYALRDRVECPEPTMLPCCDAVMSEIDLIVHLNDCHEWDLLKIARTLGVPEESMP